MNFLNPYLMWLFESIYVPFVIISNALVLLAIMWQTLFQKKINPSSFTSLKQGLSF